MEIRPCRPVDVEVLEEHVSTGPSRHDEERYRAQEAGAATFLIAWREGVPVGHVSLLLESRYDEVRRSQPGMPEINALSVWPPDQRRRGVGSALMAEAECRASASGATEIGLACEADNAPALAMYARLGYRRWEGTDVVDEWCSAGDAGEVTVHRDPCGYYIKQL